MTNKLLTYISLFSSAGIGCYGFKEQGFECVATNEILEKRLNIQKYNAKCKYSSGYILGDIRNDDTKRMILQEIDYWKEKHKISTVDAIIATPPCQGMSLANHKKNNEEHHRNSLVIESIKVVKEILPNFFIFENVRTFLTTTCTDIDGSNKKIKTAIEDNLTSAYNISFNIINFKDYGCPSSRTRALVIGVKKELVGISPAELLPDRSAERTLRDTIGHLPSLKTMGQIDSNDIFHGFKKYDIRMLPWIENLSEGQSAFDNADISRIPHTIKNGIITYNKNINSDKYRRQLWDKVGPCIHTRNDILSSQNTVHPSDNRVFSIRELMLLMAIPQEFKWTLYNFDELNKLSPTEKQVFLAQHEMTIRHAIGDAVPTIIFKQIAGKIKSYYSNHLLIPKDFTEIIRANKLHITLNLISYISLNPDSLNYLNLLRLSELANNKRTHILTHCIKPRLYQPP